MTHDRAATTVSPSHARQNRLALASTADLGASDRPAGARSSRQGFYNKTFMGPAALKNQRLGPRLYEPAIRRAWPASARRRDTMPDPDRLRRDRYAHSSTCSSSAPAPPGIAAALAAAASGRPRVILMRRAGRARRHAPRPTRRADARWLSPPRSGRPRLVGGRAAMPNVRVLPRTHRDRPLINHGFVGAVRAADRPPAPGPGPRDRASACGTASAPAPIVLATGAIERPLVFAGQRSPRHDAGGRGSHLSEPLRRDAPAPRALVAHRA